MSEITPKLQEFVAYTKRLKGDEKGEAQVFLDRLFIAFGHQGYKEAGATLEDRVKQAKGTTKFADLVWRPRLLLEMKSRGEKLEQHYRQAFEYWLNLVPHRPRYVVLCNFDEFWIYDFDRQLDQPVDAVAVEELPIRYTAFNFLFPEERKPIFGNDRVAVTRSAADKVAKVFNALVRRGEDRARAQRFILQCVVALFAEDFELLPRGMFLEVLRECEGGGSAYDIIGGLFRQMNSREPAHGGRFKEVPYFNGGLFSVIEPVDLADFDVHLLTEASAEDWAKINPAVFGTLFQASMDQEERHAYGAHFTSEADIMKIVLPTIVRPWEARIAKAGKMKELLALWEEMKEFKVLDPACGSGNFLYCAYRELKRLEGDLRLKLSEGYRKGEREQVRTHISIRQMYGFDRLPFAVELSKVTLLLAKELAIQEERQRFSQDAGGRSLDLDPALPLDNLDEHIRCADALLDPWPKVNAVIGNPPFQSHKTLKDECGDGYVEDLRRRYPGMPGKANYCVYWFRRAHQELPPDGRAGLIGTNNIRSNESRKGGLDHILATGGTISEAVSTQDWSGDAAVHVSIVNWVKGAAPGSKRLYRQAESGDWSVSELQHINASLSEELDVSGACVIAANRQPQVCFQGQTHGDDGFLLSPKEARAICADPSAAKAVHPYLTGDNLLRYGRPARFVIDLNHCEDVSAASRHGRAFDHVREHVMPQMAENASKERKRTGKERGPRQQHFQSWWCFWRSRADMMQAVSVLPRYVVCVRHTRRPIFEFIHPEVHPNDALTVFALADDYSFGILSSTLHWLWFKERCSTLEERFRYTSDTVFDSFPWPQGATGDDVARIAGAATAMRATRREIMQRDEVFLRELYRSMELPGKHPLKDAQAALDDAVREAYGKSKKADPLGFLLALNQECAAREKEGKPIVGPGVPPGMPGLVTEDCVRMPKE